MVLKILPLLLALMTSACSRGKTDPHVIADIPEASGICYSSGDNLLYVVGDEGNIYALSPEGKILRRKFLGKYDLEGIACDPKQHRLLAAVEGKEEVLVIDPERFKLLRTVKIKRDYKGKTLLKKDKKHGFEGITIDDQGDLWISNQSKHYYPHADPSVIVRIDDLSHKKAKISGIIDPRKRDISGLAWQNGYLYMVSDTNDRLYRYNMSQKRIDREIKLPKFAQEGVTFAPGGRLYFADDNGHVLMFDHKRAGSALQR
ncbi:MAG TPA: hypothetical protein ENK93_00495 [Campylobacteraceae bacterium]|nr:hypothetical protein [Campylobacteraceae bacterium]